MKKFVERRWPSVRVVALGGGTGLSAVLRGLKEHIAERGKRRPKQSIADLTAVVTVTDDGGSSGRLRREYRVLPPATSAIAWSLCPGTNTFLEISFSTGFRRGTDLRATVLAIYF